MPDQPTWTEDDSALYRELAAVAVPDRAEQIAVIAALAPFGGHESFRLVELAAGEGLFAAALLAAFPKASYVGLDGSASMRDRAAERLREFAGRAELHAFDLAGSSWHGFLDGAGVVFSSLSIHHLPAGEKRALFRVVHSRLSPGGALLIADLVEPQHSRAGSLFAAAWDRRVAQASVAHSGDDRLRRRFDEGRWNHYRFADAADRPSPLFHQLRWIEEAGFDIADCFWLQAGHAIFGGYKAPIADSMEDGVSFENALAIAMNFAMIREND
ncbi:Methyltransferase type 12 [Candidatus Sulfopaludibacter sp. SbA4]|nr:Methyltransferase type 12 [Candidatus Sulfopaludibacter sp. SbA4]